MTSTRYRLVRNAEVRVRSTYRPHPFCFLELIADAGCWSRRKHQQKASVIICPGIIRMAHGDEDGAHDLLKWNPFELGYRC